MLNACLPVFDTCFGVYLLLWANKSMETDQVTLLEVSQSRRSLLGPRDAQDEVGVYLKPKRNKALGRIEAKSSGAPNEAHKMKTKR